jgi:CHAT domain-containing protein
VVAPALPLLPGTVTRLIVVGDGPLQDLPFDALLLPDGRPVLERFEVSVLATPAVLPLLRQRDGAAAGRGALALAVEQPGRRSPVDGSVLPSLRQAAAESRTVAARYDRGRALVGADAQEAVLYRRTSPLAALHIAAHAAIDPVVESNSAIMLAAGGGHDGNLHVWEMDDLGVAAGLVVLSGCRTGIAEGVANSGGVLGFTAPLLLAGTQTVVATQWDLSDRAAAEMMATFHRELAQGRDAGAALRAAKRAQLARGRAPAQWAVFQLIGDPGYRITAQR